MSLGHPVGQAGVYRPVSRGFPVVYFRTTDRKGQNCLQWGRCNLVDPAGLPKIGLLNRGFGGILAVSLRKTAEHKLH